MSSTNNNTTRATMVPTSILDPPVSSSSRSAGRDRAVIAHQTRGLVVATDNDANASLNCQPATQEMPLNDGLSSGTDDDSSNCDNDDDASIDASVVFSGDKNSIINTCGGGFKMPPRAVSNGTAKTSESTIDSSVAWTCVGYTESPGIATATATANQNDNAMASSSCRSSRSSARGRRRSSGVSYEIHTDVVFAELQKLVVDEEQKDDDAQKEENDDDGNTTLNNRTKRSSYSSIQSSLASVHEDEDAADEVLTMKLERLILDQELDKNNRFVMKRSSYGSAQYTTTCADERLRRRRRSVPANVLSSVGPPKENGQQLRRGSRRRASEQAVMQQQLPPALPGGGTATATTSTCIGHAAAGRPLMPPRQRSTLAEDAAEVAAHFASQDFDLDGDDESSSSSSLSSSSQDIEDSADSAPNANNTNPKGKRQASMMIMMSSMASLGAKMGRKYKASKT